MDSELRTLLGGEPEIKKIASGFTSAGGPAYSRIGYLLFTDAPAEKIWKVQDGAVTVFREKSNGANSVTYDHQGRLLACETSHITRTEKDGTLTRLAAATDPKDLVYAIDGNVYFAAQGGIFRVKEKKPAVAVSSDCKQPVGLALSPTQQQLYVTDAEAKNVRVFDIDADGALTKGRIFAPLTSGLVGGLKTDEDGRVWVACAGGISVFSRDGKALGLVPILETPSNLNWGEGFRNLFVTAQSSVYHINAKLNGTRTY